MKIISMLLFVSVLGCSHLPNPGYRTLDFGLFTLLAPNSWTKLDSHGIDSYAGAIAIGNKDTIYYDLGWYSNDLTEPEPVILDSSWIGRVNASGADKKDIVFVKNNMEPDPYKYKKNNVSWDTIDGHKAKIVYTRQPGIGTTGVYIDSLWQAGSAVDRFNLYGNNLQPANEKLLLEAIRTLTFHKKK